MSTNTPDRAKAIDKVQKLLAMANDARGNENEAANAASAAEKLMRKYQISAAEVIMEELTHDEAFYQEFAPAQFGLDGSCTDFAKRCPKPTGVIAIGVAEAFDIRVSLVYTAYGLRALFSGYHLDVQLGVWIYGYLNQTMQRLAAEQPAASRDDFRAGVAATLQRRLYAIRTERDAENQQHDQAAVPGSVTVGTAVALYDAKKSAVDERFGEQQKRQNKTGIKDMGAYSAGAAAAERINLHQNGPVENKANQRKALK